MSVERGEVLIPPLRAEDLSLEYLEKLPIDVPPLRPAYQGIQNAIEEVSKGFLNSAWFTIIGLYGTGKTLLLRRIAHEAAENYSNVVPIYFYLGQKEEILLFSSLGKFISEMEVYIEKGLTTTKTHGKREAWQEKLKVLKGAYETVKVSEKARGKLPDIQLFFEVMVALNKEGYYPLIVLDEFERVVYTGEGVVGSTAAIDNFIFLSQHFLELTRGHIFKGVGVLALTDDLPSLVRKAKDEGRPHVRDIELSLGRDYRDLELTSPNIVFSGEYRLDWNSIYLDNLCKKLNIVLPQDFIDMLSGVLPTPRAVITIARRARELQISKVEKKEVYELIRGRVEKLIGAIQELRMSDGRPLIFPTAKWDERFMKLLENGYYVVKRSELPAIGKLIAGEGIDEKKARNVGRSILDALVDYGLYEKEAKAYSLRRELMAYFLDIERLPSGAITDLKAVSDIIKRAVEEKKKKAREYKERKTSKEKST